MAGGEGKGDCKRRWANPLLLHSHDEHAHKIPFCRCEHYNKINLHLLLLKGAVAVAVGNGVAVAASVAVDVAVGVALLAPAKLLEPKSGNYSFYELQLKDPKHVNHKN